MRSRLLILLIVGCTPIVTSYSGARAPTGLSYGTDTVVWVRGQAIGALAPTVAGGVVTNFSIAPALPPGITLDGTSGTLAGTPSTVLPLTTYVASAANNAGVITTKLAIRVAEAPPALTYAGAPITFVQGQASTTGAPANIGGPILACQGAGLPAGLEVAATSCEVHGFPVDVAARATYTMTAHYSEGDISFPLDLQINQPLQIVPPTMTTPGIAGLTTKFTGVGGRPPLSFRKLSGAGAIDATSGTYTTAAFGSAQIEVLDAGGSTAVATVSTRRGWANGPVQALAVDRATHALFFGGQFDRTAYFSAPNIAAIQIANGAPDLTVDFQSGFDGPVTALAADASSLYVGGDFLYYRGQSARHLAKIDLATGALDPSFNQLLGLDGNPVKFLTVVNHIVYLGTSASFGGATYRGSSVSGALLILSADDGTLLADDLPASGNGGSVLGMTGTVDGIVAIYDSSGANFIARYRGSEAVWSESVASTPSALVVSSTRAIAATADGFSPFDADTGAPAASISVTALNASAMVLDGSTVYVAGGTPGASAVSAFDAATLAPLHTPFASHSLDGVATNLIISGDALVVAGAFTHYDATVTNGLVALNLSDGAPSSRLVTGAGFAVGDVSSAATLAVDSLVVSGSRLLVGGQFALYQGVRARNLARFDTLAHTIDANFVAQAQVGAAADSTSAVHALALDSGGLYVGGGFTAFGPASTAAKRLVRIDATTGALDPQFLAVGQGFDNGVVSALGVLSEYNVVIAAGSMSSLRGTADFGGLAALATPSNAYASGGTHYGVVRWTINGGLVNSVFSPDGVTAELGGSFASVKHCSPGCATVSAAYFAAIDVNSSSAQASLTAFNGTVTALTGRLYENTIAVGAMNKGIDVRDGTTGYGPVTPTSGSPPVLTGTPTSVTLASLDRYLFVGGVSAAGSVTTPGLARLESMVSTDGTYPAYVTSNKFNANLRYGGNVLALTESNGQLYVAGQLSDSDGNALGSVMVLDAETGASLE